MAINDMWQGVQGALLLGTTLACGWNAWSNRGIALALAELQLNLRREYNGTYVRLDRFEDLKEHVRDLETVNAEHKAATRKT